MRRHHIEDVASFIYSHSSLAPIATPRTGVCRAGGIKGSNGNYIRETKLSAGVLRYRGKESLGSVPAPSTRGIKSSVNS